MEALSGLSLDHVRVRYDSPQPANVGALAYTRGHEIDLAPGEERHLPHEAWHVVQQARGRARPMGSVAGHSLNDDVALEREADVMGTRAARMPAPASAPHGPAPAASAGSPAPVIQRVIAINGKTYRGHHQPPARLVNTTAKRAHWDKLARSDAEHTFSGKGEFLRSMTAAQDRKAWWNQRGGAHDGTRMLSPHDPKFTELVHEVTANHRKNPYSADALHEGGPLMSTYMQGDKGGMFSALSSLSTWSGKDADDRPDLQVSRIEMIKREGVRAQYDTAKAEIQGRVGRAHQKNLYSGHGTAGMNHIALNGHDPSYGAYDPKGSIFSGKGHGAHGRGAYFSDQVDKALSYASAGQGPGEERSFFRQKVLLGNTLPYTERGKYRHRHHNEMVRTHRNGVAVPANLTRAHGDAETPGENMAAYDSLKGRKSYEPGSGLVGTAWHRSEFDSNEYMVRNADQVLPQYRIHYRLKPRS
jgi:hypothetical protein